MDGMEGIEEKLDEIAEKIDQNPRSLGEEFTESLFQDEGKVAAIMNKLVEKVETATTKIETVEEEAKRLAKENRKLIEDKLMEEEKRATSLYHNKYEDIAKDPEQHAVFNAAYQRLLDEGDAVSAVHGAAKRVKEIFGEEKEKLKRPLDQAAKGVQTNDPAVDETELDIIKEMAAERRPFTNPAQP